MPDSSGGQGAATLSPRAPFIALAMLTVVYAFNFIDRQILVILQEMIKEDMGLSDAQLGLLSGFSFALIYVTAGIPIAYWADRASRKNIISISLAVWSGMTALSGMAQNYTHLLLARIGVGLGEAGGSPPAHSMISDYFPPEKRATAMSVYSSGLYLGILLGYVIGGMVADVVGWRVTFFLLGVPGVLFALVLALVVKEPPRGRWEDAQVNAYKPTLAETLKVLASYRSFVLLALGTAILNFGGYGTGNFSASLYLRIHGLSLTEVGLLLAVAGGLSGMIGTFLGGYIGDRLALRDKRWYLWVPMWGALLSTPASLLYYLADNTALAITGQFFATVLYSTFLGPCLAISHTLVHPAMRAFTSAVLFFTLNLIGLGLGPLTTGIISDMLAADYGVNSLRYAMVIVSLIGTISAVFFYAAGRYVLKDLENGVQGAQAGKPDPP
ncbi:MAG: MFS transporter [Halioglobus sp.]|nr:MFS transporter [Halioglobus sp.]